MARRIEFTNKFKKDLKRLHNNKAKLNKVAHVIELLAAGEFCTFCCHKCHTNQPIQLVINGLRKIIKLF